MSATLAEVIRLGMIGYGLAVDPVVGSLLADDRFQIVGCADPDPLSRSRFAERVDGYATESVEELLDRGDLDAVYIATPTRFHEEQTLAALERGLHVLVEKPIALSLESAVRMVELARRQGRVLMVNHKRSADREILTMNALIREGGLGEVYSANRWHLSDWFYRPRAEEERDPAYGGVVLRQGAHEFDVLLALLSSQPRSMRAQLWNLDPQRPGEGAYHAWLECADGSIATSFYSGYDFFRSDELTVGPLPVEVFAATRHRLQEARSADEEYEMKRQTGHPRPTGVPKDIYGFTLASCARGDLRSMTGGTAWVYDAEGRREYSVNGPAGTQLIIDELYHAIADDIPAAHTGEWGLACLEMCVAVRQAAETSAAVTLQHQQVIDRQRPLIARSTGQLVER